MTAQRGEHVFRGDVGERVDAGADAQQLHERAPQARRQDMAERRVVASAHDHLDALGNHALDEQALSDRVTHPVTTQLVEHGARRRDGLLGRSQTQAHAAELGLAHRRGVS